MSIFFCIDENEYFYQSDKAAYICYCEDWLQAEFIPKETTVVLNQCLYIRSVLNWHQIPIVMS